MKILLYEEVSSGHHGVVLNYVQTILNRNDIAFVTVSKTLKGSPDGEYAALQHTARLHQADLIHVLSIDGSIRNWLWCKPYHRQDQIPVVANYYRYDNLHRPLRRWAWWWMVQRGLVATLLISDDYWRERRYPARVRACLRFVPDPWWEREFPRWTLAAARERLKLSQSRRVLLLFGEIAWRKGADVLLRAFLETADPATDLLLLAGRINGDLDQTDFNALLQLGLKAGSVRLDDGFVPEAEVSVYFHACDAVACAYPAWNQVSSGTFTRACAAGRPVLASDAGVTGRTVRENDLGFLYPADDFLALKRALRAALAEAADRRAEGTFVRAAGAIAKARNLETYETALLAAYAELIPKQTSAGRMTAVNPQTVSRSRHD